jgi:hypothetical protein
MFGIPARCATAALMVLSALLAGCTAPRWETATYEQFPLNRGKGKDGVELIRVIAMTPGGGALSDAVATELSKRGFVIVTAASTQALAADVDFKVVSELDVPSRRSPGETRKLRYLLRAHGVDAVVVVQAHDFQPRPYRGRAYWQQAALEVHSTTEENAWFNGAIAGTSFINFREDRPSSPAEAAQSMVTNLAIGPGGI